MHYNIVLLAYLVYVVRVENLTNDRLVTVSVTL